MPRGRGGRGRRGNQRLFRAVNRHQNRLSEGTVLRRLSPVPPPVKVHPWFGVVLTWASKGNYTMSAKKARDQLFSQLGWNAPKLDCTRFRFRKIRVWVDAEYNTATASSPFVSFQLKPYSLIGENWEESIEAWSGNVRYASAGYVWPRHQQNTVFDAGVNIADTIFKIVVSDPNAPWVIYLDMEVAATGEPDSIGNCISKLNAVSLNPSDE